MVMSWKEYTVADIVQNNMESQEDTADLERESATEDSGLNNIGPEDTRVNLEGTETSEYAPCWRCWSKCLQDSTKGA